MKFVNKSVIMISVIMIMMFCLNNVKVDAAVEKSQYEGKLSINGQSAGFVKSDGSLWMWGRNDYGQLGDGSTINKSNSVKIMDSVAYIDLGFQYTAAIKTDGSLWMWGRNDYGQLGDGTKVAKNSPTKIMDNVVQVSICNRHSAAVKEDGSLWIWGRNYYGQLGNGTTVDSDVPIKIMDDVSYVSIGNYHSLAIKTDGSLWTWGHNKFGELGDGTGENKNTPVKIMENVSMVDGCGIHNQAIKTDGSLWVWGHNVCGQLGDNTKTSRFSPIKIMDDVSQISIGANHSAAVKTDGSLWIWGNNEYGQLGDGTTTENISPKKIMENVDFLALGGSNTSVIKDSKVLCIWGDNTYGQIGNGTTDNQLNPVVIEDDVNAEGAIGVAASSNVSIVPDSSQYYCAMGQKFKIVATVKTEEKYVENSHLYIGYLGALVNGSWSQITSWYIDGGIVKVTLTLNSTDFEEGTILFALSVFPADNFKEGSSLYDNFFYVTFLKSSYSVKYDTNGGDNNIQDGSVIYNCPYGELPIPTKTGYDFLGWYTEKLGGIKITSETIVTKMEDHILYAHWNANKKTYIISYNANGGIGAPSEQEKEEDVSITLSDIEPTKAGYTFSGWSTSDTSTSVNYLPGEIYTDNNSITLYAVWKKNPSDDADKNKEQDTQTGESNYSGNNNQSESNSFSNKDQSTTSENNSSATVSNNILLKKGILKTVKSPQKRIIRITWKKLSGITGYNIYISAKKDFSRQTYQRNRQKEKTSIDLKGLKSKKIYYVKIRPYKKVGKKKIYGIWSKVKKVKIK